MVRKRVGSIGASIIFTSTLMLGVFVAPVQAVCSDPAHETLLFMGTDVTKEAGGKFCSSQPNLFNVEGPCWFTLTNWNDCASSAFVKLGSTWCAKYYLGANYTGYMSGYTFWGPLSNRFFYFGSIYNDGLTSFKFYQKTPATPSGNC